MTQANRPAQPLAIGSLNTLVIRFPGIAFMYQIDLDVPSAKNDEITLEHNESDWAQIIKVADLTEVEEDWVELFFTGVPKTGSFNLLQDPKDDEEPFYVFWDVPYEELGNLTPEAKVEEEPLPELEEEAEVVEEDVTSSSVSSAQSDDAVDNDAMTIDEKRELLKDMEITYTSTQVATEEEVLQEFAQAKNDAMTIDEKRELLKDMEITYTSTQVATEAEVLAQAKSSAEETTSGLAGDVLPDNVSDVAATAAVAASVYAATKNGVDASIVSAVAVTVAEALAKKK